jgi:hypothetical protein
VLDRRTINVSDGREATLQETQGPTVRRIKILFVDEGDDVALACQALTRDGLDFAWRGAQCVVGFAVHDG